MSKQSTLGSDFARIWSASLVTNLSDGVMWLAVPLLAVSLTEDPVLIGTLSALSLLPWLFFAIPIGVFVDRTDRRKALILGNLIRTFIGLFLAFSIAQQFVTIWILFIAVFAIGACEVLVDTTSQSILPQILEKKDFEKGNSRLQISEVIVAQFAGTPLSGFLYAIMIALPFYFSTTGFLIAAVVIAASPFIKNVSLNSEPENKPERLGLLGDIKFAMSYIRNHPQILSIVIVTTTLGFFFSLSNAIMPLFVLKELGVAPSLFGVVLAIQGIGALIGSVFAPKISKVIGRGNSLGIAIVATSFMTLFAGLSPNVYLFVMVQVVAAFTVSIWNILLMSLYQSLIPTHLYGRIHGARRTLVWGLMPIGSVLGGFIAKGGLRLPFLIGGLISIVISIFAFKKVTHIGNLSADLSN